jgi:DNA (cytosine-5)-methyltransferase 1
MLMTAKKASRKSKPTVLDIFCGAGGMSLGFKNAGCDILGGIDHNRYAIETHHQNFPSSKLKLPHQDILNLHDLDTLGLVSNEV